MFFLKECVAKPRAMLAGPFDAEIIDEHAKHARLAMGLAAQR